MSEAAARFRIGGRVQGVCFRAATRDEALRLGLRGHARNLDDGTVEVAAAGERHALDALAAWLQHGLPDAHVERVERQETTPDGIGAGFTIVR